MTATDGRRRCIRRLEIRLEQSKEKLIHPIDVLKAKIKLSDSELDLAGMKQQRIAILKQKVKYLKELELYTRAAFEAGFETRQTVSLAKASRLAGEIKLARQEGAGDDTTVDRLLAEQRDTYGEFLAASRGLGAAGIDVLFESLVESLVKRSDAEVELASGHDERIVILEQVVRRLKQFESCADVARELRRQGGVGAERFLKAKAARLKAEITLRRVRMR